MGGMADGRAWGERLACPGARGQQQAEGSARTRHMPQPSSIIQARSWDREQDVLQYQLMAMGTGSSAISPCSRHSPASLSLSGAGHDAGLGGL